MREYPYHVDLVPMRLLSAQLGVDEESTMLSMRFARFLEYDLFLVLMPLRTARYA